MHHTDHNVIPLEYDRLKQYFDDAVCWSAQSDNQSISNFQHNFDAKESLSLRGLLKMYQQYADNSQHLHQYFQWTTKILDK